MAGNMAGSTLATAPAFILGRRCDIIDLDGPRSLADDPLAGTLYSDGLYQVPWTLTQRGGFPQLAMI